jgi:hypothetical protein
VLKWRDEQRQPVVARRRRLAAGATEMPKGFEGLYGLVGCPVSVVIQPFRLSAFVFYQSGF